MTARDSVPAYPQRWGKQPPADVSVRGTKADHTLIEAKARTRWSAGLLDSPLASYYLVSGATVLLLVFGLVMVLSSSAVDSVGNGDSIYAVFLDQTKFALFGMVPMLIATRLRPSFYKRFAWPGLALGFALQCLIFTPMARGKGGNMNWVYLGGGITIQPSEFLKVALAVWLGTVLARKAALLHTFRHIAIPGLVGVAVALALVLKGHDLGTASIIMVLAVGAFWVAGVPLRYFIMAAVGLVAVVIQQLSTENRQGRIEAWLSNSCTTESPLDADLCYQSLHGMWGFGTGGLTGVGLGAGRQKWYLPEAHNDFIFPVIGEELGLIGTLSVLALFGVLGYAMLRIIRRHPDRMVKITTAAIASWIIGQMFVNVAVTTGLLPVIGIPLPLVSAGGSALIATMLALGIVIAFARDEPGAREALAARRSPVARSMAVLGRYRPGGKR